MNFENRWNVDSWNAFRVFFLGDVTERRVEAAEAIQAPRCQVVHPLGRHVGAASRGQT